uniref:Uncharacterized protein n=1 Tax=Cacopsylla melanoneura TaxID=428564 RepID=A0A8D8T6X4_9HEMI
MRMSSSTRFINLLLISNFLTSITFFGLIWIGFGPICTHSLSLPWIFTWLNFMAITYLEFLAPSPCCYYFQFVSPPLSLLSHQTSLILIIIFFSGELSAL